MGSSGEVTLLLADLKRGNPEAMEQLIPLVYGELHRLARHYMRNERVDHTLQTTALINEAYLRLVDLKQVDWQDRAHFVAVAAGIMRRILVDYARARQADKRGGPSKKLDLGADLQLVPEQFQELPAIDEALSRLSSMDPRQSRIVELRFFFGGLTVEETASVLGISPKTVKRDWAIARAWLRGEIGGERPS